MRLTSLSINNIRRIQHATVSLAAGANLISGRNGSGKTSFLEAIFLLGNGKSFRTHRFGNLITDGKTESVAFGEFVIGDETFRVGIQKQSRSTKIKINGETILAASSLAKKIPFLLFNAESYDLLSGGPSNRRALLDRTLFHVEPSYLDIWRSYHHALKQRNALLKQRSKVDAASYWHEVLAQKASEIDGYRLSCVLAMNDFFNQGCLGTHIGHVTFDYDRGWPLDEQLVDRLNQTWSRDLVTGTTRVGVHRSELKILVDGKNAASTLSRGQGKLMLTYLVAFQTRFIKEHTNITPVLLVDDLAAELDRVLRGQALHTLFSEAKQVVISAIEEDQIPEIFEFAPRVFHVEQGNIQQLSSNIA